MEKEIIKKEKKPIIQKVKDIKLNDVNTLIQCAIQNQAGVEQLKELMKMKYIHEEREAKKKYHEAFCLMQAELPVIPKTKKVVVGGQVIYRYAPLDTIVKAIIPCLKKFGFSYSWTESFDKPKMKTITCHITGYGHSESASIELPIMSASKMTNDIQQAGSTSTYGKRYTLSGILGIMVDEDDDNRRGKPIKNITPETTEEEKIRADIDVLFKKLGCDTNSKKAAITGLNSFQGLLLDGLKNIKKDLQEKLNGRP